MKIPKEQKTFRKFDDSEQNDVCVYLSLYIYYICVCVMVVVGNPIQTPEVYKISTVNPF